MKKIGTLSKESFDWRPNGRSKEQIDNNQQKRERKFGHIKPGASPIFQDGGLYQ